MGNVVLQMQHITKRYPGVVALNDVSVDFEAGQVHAPVSYTHLQQQFRKMDGEFL